MKFKAENRVQGVEGSSEGKDQFFAFEEDIARLHKLVKYSIHE